MSTDSATQAVAKMEALQKGLDTAAAVAGPAIQQPWSQDLVRLLTFSILGFTAFALLLAAILLWRSSASAGHVLRTIGVILILGLSATVMVIGYDHQQLTPIIGLFGAIAGYLLGRDSRTEQGDGNAPRRGDGQGAGAVAPQQISGGSRPE